jgi:hypothetical protein
LEKEGLSAGTGNLVGGVLMMFEQLNEHEQETDLIGPWKVRLEVLFKIHFFQVSIRHYWEIVASGPSKFLVGFSLLFHLVSLQLLLRSIHFFGSTRCFFDGGPYLSLS